MVGFSCRSFRVAHMTLDADGRQVGQRPASSATDARDMPINGSPPSILAHFCAGRSANGDTTALKAMRTHWPQMVTALLHSRRLSQTLSGCRPGMDGRAYRNGRPPYWRWCRCPPFAGVRMRMKNPSARSSLFRVTDGLRMVMHQMMFVPVGETNIASDAPMSAAAIYDYAERNYSFHFR